MHISYIKYERKLIPNVLSTQWYSYKRIQDNSSYGEKG